MTEEVEAVEVDDAAFAAGFAEARGDEPPAEEAKQEEQQPEEVAEEVKQEEAQPEEVAEAEPVTAGLTDAQLTSLLAKVPELENATADQIRKVYGKIGEMQGALNALKANGSGGKARLVVNENDPVYDDFPEFKRMLAGLSVEGVSGGAEFDPASIEPILEQRTKAVREEVSREMEQKLLTLQHRDWQSVVSGDDFKVWSQTLDAETQSKLGESWDAMYLGEKIGEFKEWRDRTKNVSQTRQNRLQAAVVPQGTPAVAPQSLNEDDAFLAGWKSARNG